MAESESDIRITTDTSYLVLMGELWGVYCEDFIEIWPSYNSTALYISSVMGCHGRLNSLALGGCSCNLNSSPPRQKGRPFVRIFSDAFLWMKSFSYLTITQQWFRYLVSIGSDNGLSLIRRQAIVWTNADQIHWHIYVSLRGDELNQLILAWCHIHASWNKALTSLVM